MFSEHLVHSINRSFRYKFLKIFVSAKLAHVVMVNHIIGHAEVTFVVLIWLAFAYSVRELPRGAFFAVWSHHFLLNWLVYFFVEANIDEGLLFEE